jgi:hypothetical protein
MLSTLAHFCLRKRLAPSCNTSRRAPSTRRFRPKLEALEERCVPSLTQVTATSSPPWTGVVSLVARFNDIHISENGSGAFIDATHILTAAHVIYNLQSNDNHHFADTIDVLVGRNGSYSSYDGQVYHARSMSKLGSYDPSHFGSSDLAVITVEPNRYPAHFDFEYANNADQVNYHNVPLYSAGYPADSHYGATGQYMYQTAGYANGITQGPDGTRLISWQNYPAQDYRGLSLYIDGQSGSPVYGKDSQGNRIIAGVFIGSSGPTGNGYATALTSTLANWVQSVEQGSGSVRRIMEGGHGGDDQTEYSTVTTVVPSSTSMTYGTNVTFTVTVSANSGTPSGTVTLYDHGQSLGQATLQSGRASYVTSALSVGSHSITASYAGGGSYLASGSSAVTVTVNPAVFNTLTVLYSSAAVAQAGQAVTFAAVVSTSGSVPPSGMVRFYDNGVYLGQAGLQSSYGVAWATFTTSSLGVGSHVIVASYQGDSHNYASTSAPVTETITPVLATTRTVLYASAASMAAGQAVTFAAVVSTSGAVQPSGTVSFYDNGTYLGQAALQLSYGVIWATFTTAGLGVGSHAITALYAGDGHNSYSTSVPVTETITPALATTLTTVYASSSSVRAGQALTFAAVVSTSGSLQPSGTVSFYDNGTYLGQVAIQASYGVTWAAFTTPGLGAGSHSITASYSGDNHNGHSMSAPVMVTITPALVVS